MITAKDSFEKRDALSRLIFMLVVIYTISDIDKSCKIYNKEYQILGYADDLSTKARN